MPGAVMPSQPSHRLIKGARHIEDALSLLNNSERILVLLPVGVHGYTLEEIRGRQLFGIADDHNLRSAPDCANGLLGFELRRLVHNDQIEMNFARREILCHRQWSHHEAGL